LFRIGSALMCRKMSDALPGQGAAGARNRMVKPFVARFVDVVFGELSNAPPPVAVWLSLLG
jgi:hypothetical protein